MSNILRVTIEIEGPDGAATGTMTLRLEPAHAAPTFDGTPRIEGDARVGGVLSVVHGDVAGAPTPTVSCRWRRDGRSLPGTEGLRYVAVPEDDGHAIDCVVVARNAEGVAEAATDAVRIVAAAPTLAAPRAARTLREGTGLHGFDMADAFAGENLTYAFTDDHLGAFVTLDPVSGRLDVDTDRSGARALAPIGVRATNSGGSVEAAFPVGIEAMFDLYVDSRDGDDANDGRSAASPKATFRAAAGIATSETRIGLSRGSVLREQCEVPASGVTVRRLRHGSPAGRPRVRPRHRMGAGDRLGAERTGARRDARRMGQGLDADGPRPRRAPGRRAGDRARREREGRGAPRLSPDGPHLPGPARRSRSAWPRSGRGRRAGSVSRCAGATRPARTSAGRRASSAT